MLQHACSLLCRRPCTCCHGSLRWMTADGSTRVPQHTYNARNVPPRQASRCTIKGKWDARFYAAVIGSVLLDVWCGVRTWCSRHGTRDGSGEVVCGERAERAGIRIERVYVRVFARAGITRVPPRKMREPEENQLTPTCQIPHIGYTIQDSSSDDVTFTGGGI